MDSFVQNVFTIIGFGAELFFVETGVCIRRKDGEVTMDREKVISGLEHCRKYGTLCGLDCNGHYEYTDNLKDIIKANNHRKDCPYGRCRTGCVVTLVDDALALLKEQDAEIRQLRLALDIAKGTCKGIKSGGGQFADMPTMQSAT